VVEDRLLQHVWRRRKFSVIDIVFEYCIQTLGIYGGFMRGQYTNDTYLDQSLVSKKGQQTSDENSFFLDWANNLPVSEGSCRPESPYFSMNEAPTVLAPTLRRF
jgi:hypothetical protein